KNGFKINQSSSFSLCSCISPLRYCSDFRPYFTIHDSEFKEYTTRTQAPPSVILGVTNPFFAKTLQHWPHIIRIGDMKQAGEVAKQMKVKKLKNLKTLDSKPGVYTAYKPYLNKDEEIIKQLQKVINCLSSVPLTCCCLFEAMWAEGVIKHLQIRSFIFCIIGIHLVFKALIASLNISPTCFAASFPVLLSDRSKEIFFR
ncbi:hypothetical protein ATANTOWER_023075, partial [Ataeniobius toweri]|nr:hypothetical protein [Ataeniobius toweri]